LILRFRAPLAAAAFTLLAACSQKTETAAPASAPAPASAASEEKQALAAVNGEPPKCADPAVVETLKAQFLESTVLPSAQMEVVAAGIFAEEWKGRFKEVFAQRLPLAAKNIAVSGVVSDGYIEFKKQRLCAADMSFGTDTHTANIHATYTLQLTEAMDDTLLKSNFQGGAGIEAPHQRQWAVGHALRAMFRDELVAKESAAAQKLAESEKAFQEEAAKNEAIAAKAAAEEKKAQDAALEEARATFAATPSQDKAMK
jgi:hypothetical protein